jgi:hypothetical protein
MSDQRRGTYLDGRGQSHPALKGSGNSTESIGVAGRIDACLNRQFRRDEACIGSRIEFAEGRHVIDDQRNECLAVSYMHLVRRKGMHLARLRPVKPKLPFRLKFFQRRLWR